jgi:hypothetical protein
MASKFTYTNSFKLLTSKPDMVGEWTALINMVFHGICQRWSIILRNHFPYKNLAKPNFFFIEFRIKELIKKGVQNKRNTEAKSLLHKNDTLILKTIMIVVIRR